MFSKKTLKAVEAALVVAYYTPGAPVTVKEMSGLLGLSVSYLEGLVVPLRVHGIVRAVRGPGGGYQLDANANQVSLWDLVKIFEVDASPARSMTAELGLDSLEASMQLEVQAFLQTRSLAQLLCQVQLPERAKARKENRLNFKPLPMPVIPRGVSWVFDWRPAGLA
jgi:Rrf2 family protein